MVGFENEVLFYIEDLLTWSQLLIVFIVTGFTHWNIHRMLHKYRFLWRFNRLHYSKKEMGFQVIYDFIGTLQSCQYYNIQ